MNVTRKSALIDIETGIFVLLVNYVDFYEIL